MEEGKKPLLWVLSFCYSDLVAANNSSFDMDFFSFFFFFFEGEDEGNESETICVVGDGMNMGPTYR